MDFVFLGGFRGKETSSCSYPEFERPVFIDIDTLGKQAKNAQAPAQNSRSNITVSLATYEVNENGTQKEICNKTVSLVTYKFLNMNPEKHGLTGG